MNSNNKYSGFQPENPQVIEVVGSNSLSIARRNGMPLTSNKKHILYECTGDECIGIFNSALALYSQNNCVPEIYREEYELKTPPLSGRVTLTSVELTIGRNSMKRTVTHIIPHKYRGDKL